MASLKDLRDRIASVKATQKITRAMQMVAAAKLRRAQEAAEAARPYSRRMAQVLTNIISNVGEGDAPRLMRGTGKDNTHLVVVCTAERGLCGGFNSQIARTAREHILKLLSDKKNVKIITVGRKGADILRRDFSNYMIDHVNLHDVKTVGFTHADAISNKIISLFERQQFDICTLFYSEFISVISQQPTALQLIPATLPKENSALTTDRGAIYDFEPDAATILDDLIPRNLTTQVFRALLENAAGEMGAKMTAMDNATRNAGEMINHLSIKYNRQRQAQITTELIEIIAGAEAL